MKDLLEKFSSYNIFNYLLPGIVFVFALKTITSYDLMHTNIIIGAFLYYFVGLIISRIGSLILDPLLKVVGFIKFVSYSEFVAACKIDSKIELLSEINNMYRTFCAMLILLTVVWAFDFASMIYPTLKFLEPYIAVALLIILFLYSYKKQTDYIKKKNEEYLDFGVNIQCQL